MKKKIIAFAASECQPFFTSGGLGEVIGSLPKRIVAESDKEYSVIVYLPLYSNISLEMKEKLEYVDNFIVNLSWRKQYCGIYKCNYKGVKFYFIDNEYYFKREKFYGYFDDAERFAFFSKAVIETILRFKEYPDIIHCHDWQTGLIPIYLRTHYYHQKEFMKLKRIFTIHNIEYQGIYSQDNDVIEDVFGIDKNDSYLLEYNGVLNIMKGAIETSNIVSTVSPSYAEEIKSPEYAHGLELIIQRASCEGKLLGILNGIDYDFYNPEKDKSLKKRYNLETIIDKKINKKALQKEVDLETKDVPLIGMVTRLVAHKGLNILANCVEDILKEDVQVVILGTGDTYFEEFFKHMEEKYPNKLRTILAFNQGLARRIYAGCDLFLMPSASEPCGLSQMIASRYGTVPMVRETGGLKDSIKDFSNKEGNGYTFSGLEPASLKDMVLRAINDYKQEEWNEKVKRVMEVDFSWDKSAKVYVELYRRLLS